MSDFETSPPKEIEIDADGEGGEALLNKSLSPEPDNSKTNGKSKDRQKSRSKSRSRSRSRSSRHRHNRSRRRYSRSRSRSPRYKHKRSSKYSHSRSRSHGRKDDDDEDRYRDSRSPMSSRKRHFGDRENPEPNRCLGIFGLSLYTQERGLHEVFGRYGQIEEVQIVYDRQTGRSRGFGFVYYKNSDDAYEAKDRCNGIEIDGRRIRVDFSITERAHTPTPGIYLGRPSDRRSPGRGRYTSSFRRSPSPTYTYGYRRSRSFSPPRDQLFLRLKARGARTCTWDEL